MLHESKLDNKFWEFTALTAAYLLNRSATKCVNTTPYEIWNRRRPNLSGLEEFGQIVWVYVSRDVTFTKKFQEKMSREPSLKVENADIGANEEDEQTNENEEKENHEDGENIQDGETEENQGIQQEQQFEKTEEGLFLHQENYARKILARHNMENCKIMKTPMNSGRQDSEDKIHSNFEYRNAVGSLLYLSSKTRPDIAYSVNYASRKVKNPTTMEIANVTRTLRYIQGTKKTAYCDADYAGDIKDGKSTSGYIIMYNEEPTAWSSRKQQIVTTSTAESEYISTAEYTKELMFLKSLLSELIGEDAETVLQMKEQCYLGNGQPKCY
ncbi:hypothetical protein J437_LFUL015203 [Ladona fulva]|uniref:Uncharacterized protein n=1 Tax=Ladona fulva TaxID=123851 RepID=A0A8K0KIY9_LADFU|nr:hypothetical protein J437_LFUL015203 [Ladona fulva]